MRPLLALAATSGALAVSLALGCSGTPATAAEIISTRCTRCHTVDRIKIAKHDPAGWEATVTRMRKVRGAQVSEAEAQRVIEFLSAGGASQL